MALPVIVSLEIVKQLFKFGGSFRKEAIGASVTTAIVPVYIAMENVCIDGCGITQALFAPSGVQWAVLITSIIALRAHLGAKAKEAK